MHTLEIIGQVIGDCWKALGDAEFTVSGITFNLQQVLEVSVVLGLGAMLIEIFIVGGSGDFEE